MSRIAALEKILASSEGKPDPDVLYMLAQEHAKSEAWDESVRWYDRCIEVSPTYCYAYYHKALAQDGAGKRGQGIETLRTGLAVAKKAGDGKAANEIALLLDEWT